MSVFEIMSRYLLAVAIIVTCVNVGIVKVRCRRRIETKPELAEAYAALMRGDLV